MKILMLIDSLGSGGAQRQMVLLIKSLVSMGHDVSIANYYPHLNHFRSELNEVCTVIDLEKHSRWSIAPVLALRRLLKKSTTDILLSFLDTPNVYAVFATMGSGSTKVVVSERSTFADSLPNWVEKVRYCIYYGANAITVNSEHQKTSIIKFFPFLSNKVTRIYNGVDLKRFSPRAIVEDRTKGPLRLLSVASIAANKNPITLIRALAIAKKKGLSVNISWVGKRYVSGNEGNVFEECENMINRYGLDEEWEWLGERSDVPELMQSYDALIHPSYKEGFPNVVCEALASGLPVLASNIGDHAYLVEAGVSGYLFDPEKEESIFEAISSMYNLDQSKVLEMRAASRSFAESQLESKKLAENYEELFKNLTKI